MLTLLAANVDMDGNNDPSTGKVSALDKMIGKTEKVLGKVMKKESMQEKGELRESGGKAAVSAAHD
jgi:hypothetical protein